MGSHPPRLSGLACLFVRGIASDWTARMSGIASIVMTFLGILVWHGKPIPAWPFFIVAACCFVIACFRVWEKEYKRAEAARTALENSEKKAHAFPRLVATEHDVRRFMSKRDAESPEESLKYTYLCVQFRNDPLSSTPDSIAHQVACNIKYADADTSECALEGSGRWMDSIPPSPTNDAPELIDFAIGQSRQLCVAVKPIEEVDCYAIPDGKWSDRERLWRFIPTTEISAKIRLRCPYFDQTWLLRFRNLGTERGLKVLEFRQEAT